MNGYDRQIRPIVRLKHLRDHQRRHRLDFGLLQWDVSAGRLGVDAATVTNWEVGQTAPALRSLPGLATKVNQMLSRISAGAKEFVMPRIIERGRHVLLHVEFIEDDRCLRQQARHGDRHPGAMRRS